MNSRAFKTTPNKKEVQGCPIERTWAFCRVAWLQQFFDPFFPLEASACSRILLAALEALQCNACEDV